MSFTLPICRIRNFFRSSAYHRNILVAWRSVFQFIEQFFFGTKWFEGVASAKHPDYPEIWITRVHIRSWAAAAAWSKTSPSSFILHPSFSSSAASAHSTIPCGTTLPASDATTNAIFKAVSNGVPDPAASAWGAIQSRARTAAPPGVVVAGWKDDTSAGLAVRKFSSELFRFSKSWSEGVW